MSFYWLCHGFRVPDAVVSILKLYYPAHKTMPLSTLSQTSVCAEGVFREYDSQEIKTNVKRQILVCLEISTPWLTGSLVPQAWSCEC